MEEPTLSGTQLDEVNQQVEIISGGAAEIVPEQELVQKLQRSVAHRAPLRMKLGMDPSSPDIHLGHVVVLQKIRQMQNFGHVCDLVIGDFTGRIGDPTGKSETRKQLTEAEVDANARTYVQQVMKVLDPARTNIVRNADWLAKLDFAAVIRLAATVTVARMLERDDFSKRHGENRPIHIHEFFYPLMQGYDSVHLRTDIEFGGTDQKFNLLMGRSLQKDFGLEPQVAVMMPLLVGLDGTQKMSKSLGNYIGIDETPKDIYGKAMSIPDSLMLKYFQLLLGSSDREVADLAAGLQTGVLHPRDVKMRLARELVSRFVGTKEAEDVEHEWITVFQQGGIPDIVPTVRITPGRRRLVEALVEFELVPSKSEARRLIQQGGVQVNGLKMNDVSAEIDLQDGTVIQVGKRRFVKLDAML
ncbi:tyrosine--tRNA ligase [Alicyclobacillus sp. ALC3]|uniref:tyrosine--tRNA ligase n=1 Tax=Alicyclobacillus sp. ALC3 TaxID=2796143 RepID=UPI0023799F95|nr:tyrosine--tRNA ligase [Alicyclobacillus sp. ALC3]